MRLNAGPRPDFLRPVRRPHALAWLACGLAVLAVLASGWQAMTAQQALAAAQTAAQATAQAAVQATQRPVARPAAPAETAARKAVRQLRVDLDKPWEEALVSVESVAVPGVVWLALDINERGVLRLEGLAPDAASALAAAEALRYQAAWSEVLIASIDKPSAGKLRFALTAVPAQGAW